MFYDLKIICFSSLHCIFGVQCGILHTSLDVRFAKLLPPTSFFNYEGSLAEEGRVTVHSYLFIAKFENFYLMN